MEFASRADAEAYRDYMEQPETREALAHAGVEEHAPMWIGEQVRGRLEPGGLTERHSF